MKKVMTLFLVGLILALTGCGSKTESVPEIGYEARQAIGDDITQYIQEKIGYNLNVNVLNSEGKINVSVSQKMEPGVYFDKFAMICETAAAATEVALGKYEIELDTLTVMVQSDIYDKYFLNWRSKDLKIGTFADNTKDSPAGGTNYKIDDIREYLENNLFSR